MPKRKDRAVEELYDPSGKLRSPEITSATSGRVHVQLSKEESGLDVQKSMKDTSPSEKRIVKSAAKENSCMRRESGICNLCSAPCSSCMHLNLTASLMESKVEDESSDDAGRLHLLKSRACDDGQHSPSEASNLLSTTSSHDSLTENAQSKETMRNHDVPEGSEDGLECHGDNMSCVTGSKEESQYSSATKEKRSSGIMSKTVDVSFKSDSDRPVFPSSNDVHACDNLPTSQLPHCHSQRKDALFSLGNAKDSEENSSSVVDPPKCHAEKDDLLLVGPPTSKKINAHGCALEGINISPATEGCKAGLIKCSSSVSAETEVNKDVLAPSKLLMHTDLTQQSGNPTTSLEVPNMQEPQAKSLPVSAVENSVSVSDMVEDDVKVCDICGDTGREDLLSICSRCSDGAEHTYCMRTMLDKVPEGDWLCEECQQKEDAENQRAAEAERKSATVKAPTLNEKNKNPEGIFAPKLLSKSDTDAQELEGNQALKVAISPKLPAKRLTDNLEVSVSKRPAIEMSPKLPSTTSPTKRLALAQEGSFKKLNVGKVKVTHMPTSPASHSRKNSQEFVRSAAALGPNSAMTQVLPQSPRGLLSRSASFNYSKPKLKPIVEEVTQKKKMEREFSTSGTKKKGSMQPISRSQSFKTTSSSPSSSSPSNANESRGRSLNFSHPEDARGSKQTKEHIVMERKNSFKSDCLAVSSSQVASPRNLFRAESMPHSSNNNSRDSKSMNPGRKLSTPSDPTASIPKKGSENPSPPAKKQSSKLSSVSAISSLNGRCHSEEPERCRVGPKDLKTTGSSREDDRLLSSKDRPICDGLLQQELTNENGKVKEPFSLSLSGSNVSSRSGSKSIRCQRCSEVGHAAEFCTAVSLCDSKSLREATKKSRLKAAVETVMSRPMMHKDNRLDDQHDLSLASAGLSNEIASKDQLKASTDLMNLSSPGGTLDEQEAFGSFSADFCAASSASTDTVTVKQQAMYPVETAAARDDSMDFTPVSDKSKTKPLKLNPASQASVVARLSRISAIPECDCIWQGDFDVQRSGRCPELYGGIQAHLSTCASPKVLEVVKKFPLKLQLEEVHRMSVWPIQFEGSCAREDNIALYFFARDLDSYEKDYEKLLGNILKNDLALKGNVDGIELLIFPSSQLPLKSQCWNRLFFLWAVFRIRSQSFSRLNYDTQNNLFSAKSEMNPLSHDLPILAISKMDASEFSKGHVDQKLLGTGRTPRAPEAVNSDLLFESPSMKGNGQTCVLGLSLGQKSSMHEMKESAVDESHSSEERSAHEIKDSVDVMRSSERTSCLSSSGEGFGNMDGKGPTHEQKPAFHEAHESMVDDTHSEKNASYLLPQFHPSSSSDQLTSLNETCPMPRIPVKNLQLHSELYSKCASLKEVCEDTGSGADLEMKSYGQEDLHGVQSDSKPVQMFMEIPNFRHAGLAADSLNSQDTESVSSRILPVTDHVLEVVVTGSKDGGRECAVDRVTPSGVDVWREQTMQNENTLKIKSGWKCLHRNSAETTPETSGDTKMKITEPLGKQGMTDCILIDGDECKIIRTACPQEHTLENISSPEILEVESGIIDEEQKGHCADNSITVTSKNIKMAERYLFPVESGPVRDLISGNSIPLQILSSDDEDPFESDFPNLELALGAVKKPSKKGILPLFVPVVDEKNNQSKRSDLTTDVGDDVMSANLSLSLAFPSYGKE